MEGKKDDLEMYRKLLIEYRKIDRNKLRIRKKENKIKFTKEEINIMKKDLERLRKIEHKTGDMKKLMKLYAKVIKQGYLTIK